MRTYGLYTLALIIIVCAAPHPASAQQATDAPPPAPAPKQEPSVGYGATTPITGPDGVCKAVTNNSPTGLALMVPSVIESEWQQFIATTSTVDNILPNGPVGVTIASCGCTGTVQVYQSWRVQLTTNGGYNPVIANVSFSNEPEGSRFTVVTPGVPDRCSLMVFGVCMDGGGGRNPGSVTLQCTNGHAVIIDGEGSASLNQSILHYPTYIGTIIFQIAPDGQSVATGAISPCGHNNQYGDCGYSMIPALGLQ